MGDGEILRIRPECLIAFSNSVQLKKQTPNDFMWFGGLIVINGISTQSKFVTIKGPGLVYIDMKQSKMFFKKEQMSLYIIMLYAALYFTMFLVILLDRREPLSTGGGATAELAEGITDLWTDRARLPG